MKYIKRLNISNFNYFLWHAIFLAFAQNFMDVDTVIPAMLIESGGNAIHIGVMTAIMLGGSSFTQLIFAPYLSNKQYKKPFLITGINLRVFSIYGLGILLFLLKDNKSFNIIWLIFLFITIFSLSGAFANISYTDILGKAVNPNKRKTFFSLKQILSGIIVIISAFFAKKVLTIAQFPENYAYMFIIGASLLLIASLGFWLLNEKKPSQLKINDLKAFFRILKKELTVNKRLTYLLGFINTQGLALSFLPFVILHAKQTFNTESHETGMFLLFKMIGVVTISILVFLYSKKIRYSKLLYVNVLLTITLALSSILINNISTIKYLFIFGGIIYSLYSITMNGVLLEISGKENRALYTGFTGAGNILPAIFPIIGGFLVEKIGFHYFTIIYIVIVSLSVYFIYKINCKK